MPQVRLIHYAIFLAQNVNIPATMPGHRAGEERFPWTSRSLSTMRPYLLSSTFVGQMAFLAVRNRTVACHSVNVMRSRYGRSVPVVVRSISA
ncbi:hypothetical protein GGI59_005630 [Rhizobium lentis]|uniref:Uncharacterized protein n=1 Tax=Rhizobium lentis TaxID=1138194 RepID=A0A7W8XJA5_9HYPH|nr:hypothetical protein [Rhizobium lentis]MBB5553141.1 hypothetical protein [Rhizobium lentis]MBB5563928.1 hypothetical protein [Rhizobium lentis]MBB5570334.1 hypothetical protein [Rhizobium lentis]